MGGWFFHLLFLSTIVLLTTVWQEVMSPQTANCMVQTISDTALFWIILLQLTLISLKVDRISGGKIFLGQLQSTVAQTLYVTVKVQPICFLGFVLVQKLNCYVDFFLPLFLLTVTYRQHTVKRTTPAGYVLSSHERVISIALERQGVAIGVATKLSAVYHRTGIDAVRWGMR